MALATTLDRTQIADLYRQMQTIRVFEEFSQVKYQEQKIKGFLHLYIGQEAVAVGAISALRDDDDVITSYRDHGHALAKGLDPNAVMAELFGKATGVSGGKGGSMHLFDREHHMYGGHAIVGGQCPLGAGIAFAIKYNGEDGVCATFLGDGALNQGSFHESMNLAAIWNLPLIVACENNLYSMGTHIGRGTAAADDLQVKAAAYGMDYAQCDGMDVRDVHACFRQEAERIRGGGGPVFINVTTYRFKGHSMSDPQKYRTKDELGEYTEQDPIGRLAKDLLDRGEVTEQEITARDRAADDTAKKAVRFASDSPDTPVGEMYTDVYADPFGPYAD